MRGILLRSGIGDAIYENLPNSADRATSMPCSHVSSLWVWQLCVIADGFQMEHSRRLALNPCFAPSSDGKLSSGYCNIL